MRFRSSSRLLGWFRRRTVKPCAGLSLAVSDGREVCRVKLSSGGWWSIVVRPSWGELSRLDDAGPDLVEQALTTLTVAWSFPEDVSLAAVASRDAADLTAVLEAFQREVAPRMGRVSPRREAEQLFAGLISGRLPEAFSEVHLMATTGWSWDTLQTTPADVVRRMATYMAVTRAVNERQSLNFEDEEEQPT